MRFVIVTIATAVVLTACVDGKTPDCTTPDSGCFPGDGGNPADSGSQADASDASFDVGSPVDSSAD